MRLPKTVNKYRSAIFMLAGSIAFAAYLWFIVGVSSLFDLFSQLDLGKYSLYYSIAILALFMSVFFDSMIWHSLLQSMKVKMKLRKIVLYNWIGNFVEMVIPCETVCGEVTRMYLAKKDTNQNIGATAAPVITSRLLSTLVYTSGLLVGSLVLVTTQRMPTYLLGTLLLVSVASIGTIFAALYLVLKEEAAEKLVSLAMVFVKIVTKSKAAQEQQKENLRLSLYSFGEAFGTYKKRPKFLIKPIFYAVIAWSFTLLVYMMVFYSLDFMSISIVDLAMVYCVSSIVETLTAGFPVGAVEITMISLYSALGIPLVVAGAATTLTRLLTFWFQIIVGYPIFQITGLENLLKVGLSESLLGT